MFSQRFLKFFTILIVLIFFGAVISQPVFAGPVTFIKQFGDSLNKTGGAAGYPTDLLKNSGTTLTTKIGKYIQVALSLLGVLFLVLMIYGGYVWMKARGNETDVTRAKDIITNAGIGLVIVISAYAISYFVIYYLQTAGFGTI